MILLSMRLKEEVLKNIFKIFNKKFGLIDKLEALLNQFF